ncbi:putative adhesin [Streptoalloteichus tenebrarius]|uniref:Adhesin n=1 Tax=Streptoalloteichus tenebrarius (strain ATCC 17920 / DSM 40477 / JCM 4838 / CBS 697.72 / NBRC 16177 / NCIMB 11028 / NRRL B-12390 / A12253. 1 / ISP 5477) TaxID=1933 RepID=A0ABT1I2I4_STRSD|nr:DUF4097 family beta strand repeat-containing protein [Streptoalloteichus tenebrarius]MCP2262002.1 putative adhesin [Streptoalloteichus tenebrarius]BFF02123.1 hypothetical protein GCM10020241_37980 [Streptoalloteichus tenebrarius]
MRRTALFVVVAAVGAGLLSSCGWERFDKFEDDARVTEKITRVRIEDGSGEVRLRAGDTTSVHRRVSHRESQARPGPTHRVEGDTLVLGRDCGSFCGLDYDVVVPRDVTVSGGDGSGDIEIVGLAGATIGVGSGDVTVRDVSGPVSVDANSGEVVVERAGASVRVRGGSGDVRLDGVAGSVDVDAESGKLVGRGLRGETTARMGSGDIDLTLSEQKTVHARASSGAVRIRVPQGRYRVNTTTSSGSRTVTVTEDPASNVTLEATTTSGNIEITSV